MHLLLRTITILSQEMKAYTTKMRNKSITLYYLQMLYFDVPRQLLHLQMAIPYIAILVPKPDAYF